MSTERGELFIQAAKESGLSHTAVTAGHPLPILDSEPVRVGPGQTWVIIETGSEGGSRKFFAELERLETSKK
jgi:hypothetical protein